jgi:hypothetical protein
VFTNSSDVEVIGPDFSLGNVVKSFYLQPGLFEVPEMTPFCASNDCAWPPFHTLAVCSECKDISRTLQFGCYQEDGYWRSEWNSSISANFSLPTTSCGYFFNATGPKPMLMSGYAINSTTNAPGEALVVRQLNFRDPRTEEAYWDHSLNFKHVPYPIVNFATVAVHDAAAAYRNETPVAHECVLRFCTRHIAARYYKGAYTENILSTFTNDTMTPWPLLMEGDADYDYFDNITITPPGQKETFLVGNDTMLQTIFTFDYKIPQYVTQTNVSAILRLRTENDRNGSSRAFDYLVNDWASSKDIPHYVASLATSMSHAIRLSPSSSEKVLGSGSLEVYVKISWGWFVLPATLLVATLGFLLGTVVRSRTHDIGILKTSSLAILAHGLNDVTKKDVASGTLLELFDKACETQVTFRKEMDGRKLLASV